MPDTPNTTLSVIARIRGWAGANGWSKSRYAALAGLRDTTLRGFHDADWNPNTDTLQRLEALIPAGWQVGDPVPVAAEGPSEAVSAQSAAAS
jgi:ribosome-binding protein aMBF1 (putative translation factor)